MNYTFIEINKKKLPIKFGFNALRKYSSKTKTSLQDLDKLGTDMTLDDALNLIYCGIEDGYRAAKQECELSIDDLADLIDGDFDSIGRAMEILTEQMGGNNEKKPKAKK
jgi:hypothetical protein|tara:strand:+ start:6394 stop:6720 length:327 start_codon:yes stop_codon:yes gene_type:complete